MVLNLSYILNILLNRIFKNCKYHLGSRLHFIKVRKNFMKYHVCDLLLVIHIRNILLLYFSPIGGWTGGDSRSRRPIQVYLCRGASGGQQRVSDTQTTAQRLTRSLSYPYPLRSIMSLVLLLVICCVWSVPVSFQNMSRATHLIWGWGSRVTLKIVATGPPAASIK